MVGAGRSGARPVVSARPGLSVAYRTASAASPMTASAAFRSSIPVA